MADQSEFEKRITRHSASTGSGSPDVWGIYEPDTGSIQYICADPETKKAALIDVVQDFDPKSFKLSTKAMDHLLDFVNEQGLTVDRVLDTHPHADHVMASALLKQRTGARNGIGEKVKDIAGLWRDFYNLPDAFDAERDFDDLFKDGDTFQIGNLEMRVMLTTGHTMGSITYVCGDAAFVNDTFMQPDSGTARADFPGGSTKELWNALQSILDLPDKTRLFIGHDYGSDDRNTPQWEATVGTHKAENIHLKNGTTKEEYINLRNEKDETLDLPDRMLAALQLNLRAGQLPDAESDGHHYLKLPVNKF
ncbi:MBL fold metallo-hydrolase [Neptunicoccus cionae]|uniref:MBL fold metallo-hydrolase n=1 Tax=Neptunicoccus cionae TaxID=2035344 RepID=A0A916QZK2_9RHOB|nr:MBL fold metallo-hydrolase [Amylibacter cionae]GGA20149.1 MBL fold metallo-hydrolase [Amylibacter cionae]